MAQRRISTVLFLTAANAIAVQYSFQVLVKQPHTLIGYTHMYM